jgi:photosystem II stability/assembly factor-like uncharacterized protein
MKRQFAFYLLIGFITICHSNEYGWVDISKNLPDSAGTVTLPDMHWINDNEGWICSGFKGEIYHTTDGGNTFTTQATQYYTNAIYMLSSSEGCAGGYDGRIYRTTDGGGVWSVLGSIGSSLRSISFPPSSTTGYCSGDNGKIYIITSTGVSSMNSGVSANLRAINFPSLDHGWTCGLSLILNFDGKWYPQDPPSEGYNSIYMVNNITGWAVGDNGVIVNTSDGGLNWNYQTNTDTSKRALNNIFFLNASEGWAVGNIGVILHTTNGGALWSMEGNGLTTNMLRSVQFTSSTNGYALGNNGTLLNYTEISTAVKYKSIESTARHTVHFDHSNGLVTIATPANVLVEKISVMDIQGKFLKENKLKNSIDVVALPAGIYIVNVNTNNRMSTLKIVKK